MESPPPTAGILGRAARLVLGICLVIIALPVYLEAGRAYVLASLGLTLGLVAFYGVLHLVVIRLQTRINRWVGALVAVTPVFLVWYLGQGGGPLFGQGEGGTAALTFLAVSFLVDAARGSAGCEVMALPGLMFGSRTHLPCILLCPIDHLEATATDAGPS